jgi:WD40 repeat protein/serine/threonine protein kinase
MEPSSRTPEGRPNFCPVCGHEITIEPSRPAGDAPCPHCGHLLWFQEGLDDRSMPQDDLSREERVDEAIAEFLQAVERGENPAPEEFLAAHPDLAPDLQSFFANRDCFQQAAGKLEEEHTPVANEATLAFQGRGVPSPKDVIRYFGDYELLEEVARGGMGVVFKARQVKLNRIVAVKMILAGSFAGPEDVERFHTEAEAAAQLDHPGIVPIYEVGQHDGQHYFSMGFVEGQSLAKKVAEGPLPPREAAEIIKTVAEAVQYAHDKGVIHRDLKPGNILLDKAGKPRVTDFGLAKLTESGSDLTGTGQILGTPSYMPPEQAAAQVSAVGRLSDVYSLGAILYCLLTGRPPFQAASPLETLLQVQRQEPVRPRELNPNIPRDLDTIVLKCLDKAPTRRYPSAKALAEELQRYRDGRPILARPVGRLERFWRWCRREPAIASLSAAVTVALIAGSVISNFYSVLASKRAESERKAKIKAQKLADENGELAKINAELAKSEGQAKITAQERASDEQQARLAAERQSRIATAEKLAVLSHAKRSDSPELSLLLAVESGRATLRDEEGLLPSSHSELLDALSHIGGRPLVGHQAAIKAVAISPNSRWVITGSADKTARVWNLTAENPAANPRILTGHTNHVTELAISPDSRWIVTASRASSYPRPPDTTVHIWDLAASDPAAEPRVLTGHSRVIECLAISPDGHWLVTGSYDKTARIWDLTAENPGTNPRVLSGHQDSIGSLAISPDSRWLVTGSWDNTARIWDLAAENPTAEPRVLSGHQAPIASVVISPDSRWVITVNHAWSDSGGRGFRPSQIRTDAVARIWDLTGGVPAANSRILSGITNVAISPNSRWIVAWGADKAAQVWDLVVENPAASPRLLSGHQQPITSLAISPDSHWGVTGSTDKTARIWDLTAENPAASPRLLSAHQEPITNVTISPDGRWIVTTSNENTARVWDLTAENPADNSRVLSGHQGKIRSVVVSPDSRWVVVGGEDLFATNGDNTARVWDLNSGNPAANPCVLTETRNHDRPQQQSGNNHWAISPDSHWIVTQSDDRTARVWDLTARNPSADPLLLSGHQDRITHVAISPDSRWVATCSADRTARVWGLGAENRAANATILGGHEDIIGSVEFSPDSRWIVTRSDDKSARAWDLTAGNPIANPRVLSGHQGRITHLTISPDSRWVVTGSDDKTARIWDLTAENPAASPRLLTGHQEPITNVTISPNSRWIVTTSGENVARVWDLKAENPAANWRVLSGHQGKFNRVVISPDGRWVVAAGQRGFGMEALVWDLAAEDPAVDPRVLTGSQGVFHSLAISPDSRWIVTGSSDKIARVWDLTAASPAAGPHVLTGQQGAPGSPLDVEISPDSRWIVARSIESTARIWDLTARNPAANPRVLSGHQGTITRSAISPDSRWLVTGNYDHTARIWDLTAENPSANPRVLSGYDPTFNAISFSPDSRWIVTENSDGSVQLWRWQWDDLVALAGQVGRNFDDKVEWKTYFPGMPYRKTFPDLPIPEFGPPDDAESATVVGKMTGRPRVEESARPPVNVGIATDAPRTPGLSAAERSFEVADEDKNGEISEEEFNGSLLVRAKFKNAVITPTFPLKRGEFVKAYSGTPLRADDEQGLAPAGAVFVPSASVVGYVEQPAVRDELRLTPQQQARIADLRTELEAADAAGRAETGPRVVDKAVARSINAVVLLGEILTPAQTRRHNQIVMQHLLIRFGLVQLVQAIDTAAVLEFDARQQLQMGAILKTAGYGPPEPGFPGQLPPGFRRGRRGFPFPAPDVPEGALPGGRGTARGGRGQRGGVDPPGTFAALDTNGDGKLSEGEIPERLKAMLAAADADKDKLIDKDEFQKFMASRPTPGFPGQANPRVFPGLPDGNPAVAARRPDSRSRRRRDLEEFTNPDLRERERGPNAELFETANDQISALLTAPQKKRLLDLLGPPLAFRPTGSPPAVQCAARKGFAFPRVATRDGWNRSSRIGGTTLLHHPVVPALLSQAAIRNELKLTSDAAARLPPFSGDPGDVPVILRELARLLQPAQLDRLQQLALQAAARDTSLAALFEYKEVAEAIPLSDQKRSALSSFLLSDLRSTRHAVLAAVERNRDRRRDFELDAGERLGDILTREQRERLTGLLGEPFPGALLPAPSGRRVEPRLALRATVAPALGYLASVSDRFLSSWRIQQALQPASEDPRASTGFRQPGFPSLVVSYIGLPSPRLPLNELDESGLLRALTPQQGRRYTELVLQGSINREGPAVVFRYRTVLDALSPSPEQERRLLEVLWDDTRRYLETPREELAEKLPDLDRQTTTLIDAILSAEQRDKLVYFLGKPADDEGPTEEKLPPRRAEPAPETVRRRLVYPVRHGSASDLAEIVRRQFGEAGDVQAVPAPADNVILVAAPSARFDEVRATLSKLDRPRRTVIVDVLHFETPVPRESTAAKDEPWLSKQEMSGPIEQVEARLDALHKQKKLTGLRRMRLETLEGQTSALHAGREIAAITGARASSPTTFWSPIVSNRREDTAVWVTASITPANRISLDLEVRVRRVSMPEDADELGLGPDGPLIAQEADLKRLARTLTVPVGEAVLVEGVQDDAKADLQELCVIVAVRIAESTSP